MDNANRHVGFHQETPAEVVWSAGSFIRPVIDLDEREMRRFTAGLVVVFFGMFILAGGLFFLSKPLSRYYPFFESTGFMLVCAGILVSAFLLGLLLGQIYKWVLINKLRTRNETLFEPDWGCYFVGIEDAFTYDKRKLTADDFAMLKIEPGRLQLEMTKHRAQFDISELSISLLHTSKNAAGVRLTLKHDPHTWSVVLTPMGNSANIFKGANAPKRSQRLLDILTQAGAKARPESHQTDTIDYKCAEDTILEDDEIIQKEPFSTVDAEHADVMENRYHDVLETIRQKQQKRKKGWIKSMAIMVISLFVFFQLGFFRWGLEAVMMILLVLFIHEMGHFIAMKAFGYKNLQMFFIPLAGAAVSGESRNIAVWKKAIVSLSGPLPGIAIGCVVLIVSAVINQNLLLLTGAMFVGLNLLNLLPINPLDGGRFLNEVLFSRNRYFELIANILAAAVFLIAGFALKSWIFKILGFLNLFTIQYKFKLSSIADQFKAQWFESSQEDEIVDTGPEGDIPENLLKQMIGWVYRNMPGPMKTKAVATTVLQLWDRIRVRPPRAGATVGLLGLYFMGYVFSFVSIGAFAVYFARNNMYKTEIVEYQDEAGQTHYKEERYWGGQLNSETELTDDQQYYHGSYKSYYVGGAVIAEGQWDTGIKVGQWNYYDLNSVLTSEQHYEEGKLVLIRNMEDGKWTERDWEDYSEQEQKWYERESQTQQGPGKSPELEYDEDFNEPNYISSKEVTVQMEGKQTDDMYYLLSLPAPSI